VKGPDHPTPFAKGTTDHDNTASGMYFGSTSAVASEGAEAAEEEGGVVAPAGWKAEKISVELHLSDAVNVYESSATGNFYDNVQLAPIEPLVPLQHNKRVFNEADFQLEFIEHEEFGGRRPGFVFRLGAQGLGYYRDTYVAPVLESAETSEGNSVSQESC
jgi:hypothetical protein